MPNNENDASKATREKLEGIRNSLYAKYGEKGARRVVVLSAVGIVALVALLILIFLYPVREISVSGEVTMFNEGEIIEAIRRKPIAREKEAMVHLIGMVFLFGLMIFFTIRDVAKLF